MPDLFLPGPFAEADMLGVLLHGAGTEAVRDVLADHALWADPSGGAVGIVRRAGSSVQGCVVEIAGEAAARCGFGLAALSGGARREDLVTSGGRRVVAHVAGRASGPAWPERPEPEWRAHLVEVLREILSQFGRMDAEEAAGLVAGASYRGLARVRGRASGAGRAGRDVEALGLTRPYARYFAVEEHRLRHRRFDGSMSDPLDRAVFASGDAVTVLPFDPVRREVLLIEQFRAGPYARCDPDPWLLEAIAGRCDAGEMPEASARREAREEAGLDLGRIVTVGSYYPSPGAVAEYLTSYVGEARLGAAGGVHGLASEDEDIRGRVLPLGEALARMADGDIRNAPLLISLMWLGANAERLCADWGP